MPVVTFAVEAEGSGVRQDIDVIGSDHVIRSDAYPDFGGKDEFPSPLAYALAALTSCSQVTAQIVAAELGVTVSGYTWDVAADFDPSTMVGGATDADDTFSEVRLTARLTTDATPEQFETLRAETGRRCPVNALFRRAGVRIKADWTRVDAAA